MVEITLVKEEGGDEDGAEGSVLSKIFPAI
jgi:hypothetical protein